MSTTAFMLMTALQLLLVGGVFLLYPRIARRGLLFGVHVGDDVWAGEEAGRITRAWDGGVTLVTVSVFALSVVAWGSWRTPLVAALTPLLAVAGILVLYVISYRRALRLAPPGPPPPAATLLIPAGTASLALPLAAIVFGVACGLFAIAYAASQYPDLPARVPTHFGITGEPDAWRPKSFSTVMLLPVFALVMGAGLGGTALLTARAKRAMRYPRTELSAEAQARFRLAMTRMLSVISILVTLMLTMMSISSVRVGLGLDRALHPAAMALSLVLVLFGVGGTLYIAIRYGQGGSRLERSAAGASLTDGLADNRRWVLGMFYVNADDPAILVEHRFGLGYTINFGNWRAVLLLVLFLGSIIGLSVWAVLTN